MKNEFTQGNKYTVLDAFKSFFILIICIGALSVLLQIVLSIVANTTGQPYEQVSNSETTQIVTYMLTPILFICFYFIYNKIRKINNKEAWSDGQNISLLPISIAIVLAIICIFLFTPFMNLVDYLFASTGYVPDNTLPMQAKMSSGMPYFLLGLMIYALLPAISEELIFRGIIQKGLSSKFNGFTTIIMTTLLFTLMHGSLQQTVYQVLVGIMLSYVSYVGGSILYSIILHFLNNALVVVFSCFDIVGYLSPNDAVYYNIFSMIFPFLIFLLGVILVGILFWVLKYLRNKNFFRYEPKKSKKRKKKNEPEVVEPEKIGFRGMWKSLNYNEKMFMLVSLVLVGLIWIINTISGFMV